MPMMHALLLSYRKASLQQSHDELYRNAAPRPTEYLSS